MSFKTPETVVRNALMSDASVTQYVGHRIFYDLAASEDSLPFINYRRTAVDREQTLGNPMGVPRVSLELTIYATTRLQTRQIANAAREVLDGYSGSFDNTTVRQASLESESDDIVTLDGAELPTVYAVTQSYDILWQET